MLLGITDNIFKLRFFDNDVTPQSFTLKEIGELFLSFDEAIKSIVENDYPDIDADTINLSPVGIENKSESLSISTNQSPPQAELAIYKFGGTILTNSYVNLPEKAYKGVKVIYNLAEKKQCKAEMIHKAEKIFELNPTDKLIKPESVLINRDGNIYGELIKVGREGKEDKYKAWVELPNGNKLSFNVTKEQAVEIGQRMFQTFGFKGKIRSNPTSNYITSFSLYEILSYKSGNVSKAFEQLRKLSAGSWDDIKNNDDINNFLGRSLYE